MTMKNKQTKKGFLNIEIVISLIMLSTFLIAFIHFYFLSYKNKINEYKNLDDKITLLNDIQYSIDKYGYPSAIEKNKITFKINSDCNLYFLIDNENKIIKDDTSVFCDPIEDERNINIHNFESAYFKSIKNKIFELEINISKRKFPIKYYFHKKL